MVENLQQNGGDKIIALIKLTCKNISPALCHELGNLLALS